MAYQPKSYRKFLAGSVSAALVASAVGPVVANAASFSDVDPNSTHGPNILALADKGYIKGFQDGTFKPFEKISRGQAAKIFARILEDLGFKAPEKLEQVFDDVPLDAKDQELVKAAAIVKAAGVMTGSEGKLNPASNITRQQMAKVIVETFDLEKPADFKSQITDLDKADDWAREYIQTLEANGVTVVKEYRPKDNVTRGEFATFIKRAMDAQKPVTVEAEVATVSAINNTTFELNVTFKSEVTEELLKGTKLTLTGPVTVTATFSKLDGQTAVYKIDNVGALQPGDGSTDGTYKVTSTSVKVPDGTVTTYGEVLKGNQVKGFVYDDTGKPVANANVKIGNRTVKTDAYGFYSIATNSGLRTVEVTAPGYFMEKNESVEVSRNYVTAQNFVLKAFEQDKLFLHGVALNEEKSSPINGAKVTLYEKRNGDWVYVGDVTTGSDGAFYFGNTNSGVTTGTGKLRFASDELELDKQYKVVIEKGLTPANFKDVYHTKEMEVSLNQNDKETNLKNILVKPVKELESLTFELTWSPDAATALEAASSKDVTVDLIDTNGRTVLESANLGDLRSKTDNRVMPEAYDLVKKGFFDEDGGLTDVKPRIPTGTYYLRVNDGTNAITIIPVSITEGVNAVAPKTEITVAKSFSLTSSIGSIQYAQGLASDAGLSAASLPAYSNSGSGDTNYLGSSAAETLTTINEVGNARTATPVEVNFEITQNVNGVDVVVRDHVDPAQFSVKQDGALTLSGVKVTALTEFKQLKQGVNYKVTPVDSAYVKASAATITPAGAASAGTTTFASAAKIKTLDLTTNGQLPSGSVTVNNIQLINKAGQVVAETGAFTAPSPAVVDQQPAFGKLSGFTPGEYKLRIDIAGYKVKDTDYQTIYDFQDAKVTVKSKFEAIPKTTLTGYIRFADDNANVLDADPDAEATLIVLNSAGQIVAAKDLGEGSNANYQLVDGIDGKLAPGTYKAILRGPGFETIEKTVSINAGEENVLNFTVEKGGKGLVKLSIRDENNSKYKGTADAIKLFDSNWTDKVLAGSGVTVANLEYAGAYTGTFNTAGIEWTSEAALSVGTYSLLIPGVSGETYPYTDTITIRDKNDSFYDVITLKNVMNGKVVDLTVKFAENADEYDYVVVKRDGQIIATFREEVADSNAGSGLDKVVAKVTANATYTVEVYSSGKFVGSNEVTVQDFNKEVTVGLDKADRNN
ncbi:S-layer homology domain-containing protein [Parageobacillus toebii]|uniref:S-layer homology domain-containing protein n=1 Tax=Parageobacillus toebii TaxID=153151 RepID=UPI0035C6D2FE